MIRRYRSVVAVGRCRNLRPPLLLKVQLQLPDFPLLFLVHHENAAQPSHHQQSEHNHQNPYGRCYGSTSCQVHLFDDERLPVFAVLG